MLRRSRIPLFAALLALGAFFIACSSGAKTSTPFPTIRPSTSTPTQAPAATASPTPSATTAPSATPGGGAPTSLSVTMTEFAVKVDKSDAPAGSVVFKTTNGGTIDHELRVIKTDLAADKLPLAGATVDETKVQVAGTLEQLKASSSKDLTLTLQAGHYVLICNVAGHYQLGMHTDLTVK